MSVKHIGLLLDHFNAPPPIKLVALILADHADSEGVCWPSYRKIAQRACLSERSVRRYIKELQELGIITKLRTGTIVKREGQTLRISNAYRVNAHVIAKNRSLMADPNQKLSTIELGISDNSVHLEVATHVTDRWTHVTTKPSIKQNSNHKFLEPVEKLPEPIKLDFDAFIDQLGKNQQ